MQHPWFADVAGPRVLAHRGYVTAQMASDGIAENSHAAIAQAHAAGARYVESDCHLTRDGVVVLFHDDDLRRITGDPRPIADVEVRALERLMAPRGGLATLADTLDAFPTLRFNLDVKASTAAVPVGRIAADYAERVLLTSFSDRRRRTALRAAADAGARELPATSAGTATIARLLSAVAARSTRAAQGLLMGVDAIQIPERYGRLRVLTPRLIDTAHRWGVEVHVWTVNDLDDMRRLVSFGVDGIVTDRTDLAVDALRTN